MRKLNPYQVKVLITAALVAGVFAAFYFFIQTPRSSHLRHLQTEFYDKQSQIQQIENVVAQGYALEEGIKLFQKNRKNIDSKFPAKEEEGLKGISDFARHFNMEVTSLKSSSRIPFLFLNQEKVEIDGKTCYQVYAAVEMKGSYEHLVQYLAALKESLPAYISIEKLRIMRDSSGADKLSIFIDFNLYLLS